MARVAFLTLHGMGVTLKDYADDVRRQLEARLGADWQDVAFESIYYQGILQPNGRAVWRSTLADAKVRRESLRAFVLFGLADAVGLEYRKELPASAYEQAQLEVARKLISARDQLGANLPVVFLTQSLGCQVLSNYLYDAQQPQGKVAAGIWRNIDDHALAIAGHPLTDDERKFLRGDTIHYWISTGCNIPVFVAADTRMRIKPIRAPNENFRWLNIYDPDDVMGWPLRPLGSGYETLVDDRAIKSGKAAWANDTSALSCETYWAEEDVLRPAVGMIRALLN